MGPQRHSPRSVLEKFYEAERIFTSAPADQRDFSVLATVLSDDFYMEQSSKLPWAGKYHGPSGLKAFMESVTQWTVIDVRDPEIFVSDDGKSNKIVVLSRVYYSCFKSGEKLDFPLSQTFVIDTEQGRIKEIRSYYWDIAKLNKAMRYEG